MSLRKLVEDQCGTANSLVQLTTHFIQDKALKDQGLLHPFQHENFQNQSDQATELSDNSINNSESFRMDSLLSEMRELEVATLTDSVPSSMMHSALDPSSNNENISDWANQYIESGSTFAHVEEKPYQLGIWSNENDEEVDILDHNLNIFPANDFDFNANGGHRTIEAQTHFFSNDLPDILPNTPINSAEISELQHIAGQVVNSMNKPRFSDSKFLKFMSQVNDGQVQINENQVIGFNAVDEENSSFGKWANELSVKNETLSDDTCVDINAKEKSYSEWGSTANVSADTIKENTTEQGKTHDKINDDIYSKKLWSKLTEKWEQFSLTDQDPWDSEFNKFVASIQTYQFTEENPMSDKLNALEEGKKRLAEGDLSSAVLCFETAVKQNLNNSEAWQLLGRSQAENEQDQQAIAALKECIQLDPENLEALKELAVCYTNENYQYQACYALREWLARNPKYEDVIKKSDIKFDPDEKNDVTSILTMKFFNDVLNLYLKVVQQCSNTEDVDADIQNGLGVLLTLNSDYEKAIDCFETAVRIRPDDARLWNRLGATLANGQKPEQAVEAYRKALKLSSGFIRARYNLGITCVHLRMYRQAIEHLLVALNQQMAGRGISGEKPLAMSDTIWTTLRLALSLSNRRDLISTAENRDLNLLNKEFDISTQKDVNDL